MAGTPERYAVVSCHVERILDDEIWRRFSSLQALRPGGLAIAALIRPPDVEAGESEDRWLARAREVSSRGPFGHHAHWTSPTHARPTGGGDPADRVRRDAAWLRNQGLAPTLFCGGGWYTDAGVAAACADLGYADCTPRSRRPAYLAPDAAWAELPAPATVVLPDGARLRCLPTTHALGELVRALLRPSGLDGPVVHAYFHDTDLLDRRRRRLLGWALQVLGRRRTPTDLDVLAGREPVDERAWANVARGGAGGSRT